VLVRLGVASIESNPAIDPILKAETLPDSELEPGGNVAALEALFARPYLHHL
jgi:hypothetical protein